MNQDLLNEIMADDDLDPARDREGETPPGTSPTVPAAAVNQDLLNEIMADSSLDPSRDKGEEAAPAQLAATPAGVMPSPAPVADAAKTPAEKPAQAKKPGGEEGGETIRVETARLDKVMNLVGELVLARNSLLRYLNMPQLRNAIDSLDENGIVGANLEQLARVTQDLQMSVLYTRMQPIKKVFD